MPFVCTHEASAPQAHLRFNSCCACQEGELGLSASRTGHVSWASQPADQVTAQPPLRTFFIDFRCSLTQGPRKKRCFLLITVNNLDVTWPVPTTDQRWLLQDVVDPTCTVPDVIRCDSVFSCNEPVRLWANRSQAQTLCLGHRYCAPLSPSPRKRPRERGAGRDAGTQRALAGRDGGREERAWG